MSAQVAAQGGHLVKFIGDEAMFTVSDPAAACRIALSAADAFRAHPLLPQVRAAVAWGDVLRRGGDFFGPTVTLAARAVEHAPPGAVAVTSTVRDAVADDRGLVLRPLAEKDLKGFDTPVQLWVIEWPHEARPATQRETE
jgi:class 3 adenylate cyclase